MKTKSAQSPPIARLGNSLGPEEHEEKGTNMKAIKHILPYAMFAVTIMAVAPSAPAQQINGTPGSPERHHHR